MKEKEFKKKMISRKKKSGRVQCGVKPGMMKERKK